MLRTFFNCPTVPRSNDTIRKRPYTIKIQNLNGTLRAVLTRSVIRPYGFKIRFITMVFTPKYGFRTVLVGPRNTDRAFTPQYDKYTGVKYASLHRKLT